MLDGCAAGRRLAEISKSDRQVWILVVLQFPLVLMYIRLRIENSVKAEPNLPQMARYRVRYR